MKILLTEASGLVRRLSSTVPDTTELHSVNLSDPTAACETDPIISQALNVTLPVTLSPALQA